MLTKHLIAVAVLTLSFIFVGCATTNKSKNVSLVHGIDDSAGGVSAYVIKTKNATYYLEKKGGGLSSMLDNDGVDWLGFNNTKGSGWKGEYRGFPNAIHKQDGNYFHALNEGTDISESIVHIESDQHIRITFTSGNGQWKGQWDFYPERCDFTMIKVSEGYKYWVQYEGVPGGEMDETDFWFASADTKSHPINEPFLGDLPAPEWMSFGDKNSSRMLYMLHHENDESPDTYSSRPYMTVFGFGRNNKDKYLNTPQTFSIGFVESSIYSDVESTIKAVLD